MKHFGLAYVALIFLALFGCTDRDGSKVDSKNNVTTLVMGTATTLSLMNLSKDNRILPGTERFDGQANCIQWVRLMNDRGQKLNDVLEIYTEPCHPDGATFPDDKIIATLAFQETTVANQFVVYKNDPNQPWGSFHYDNAVDQWVLDSLCGHPNYEGTTRSAITEASENHCHVDLTDDGKEIKGIGEGKRHEPKAKPKK